MSKSAGARDGCRETDPSSGGDSRSPEDRLRRNVRWAMLTGAILTIGLIGYGIYRFPSLRQNLREAAFSIGAGVGIATTYGLIGWFGASPSWMRDDRVLRQAVRFGSAAGVVFAVSMLGEYVVPRGERENERLAWATFGLFFALLSSAGYFATRQTNRLASGPLAALWVALLASQLWFILLLAFYYAFLETPQEARFLKVDQVLADFERHKARDLRTFIFEDYMGAGFFHSVLAPLLALPLGLAGGFLARLVFWLGARERVAASGSE
jgi:hypothetical protein